jgi:hypothetical protein
MKKPPTNIGGFSCRIIHYLFNLLALKRDCLSKDATLDRQQNAEKFI